MPKIQYLKKNIASNSFILAIISKFKNILSQSWGMMLATNNTWKDLAVEIEHKNVSIKDFVFPWIIAVTLFSFFFDGIYSIHTFFKTAFINGFITFIALFSTYYFAKYITSNFVNKKMGNNVASKKIEVLVSYSLVIIFVLKIVIAVIPSLFFLQILSVYTAFVVWEGINTFFEFNEDDRGKLMLMLSATIIILPVMIERIILFMVS